MMKPSLWLSSGLLCCTFLTGCIGSTVIRHNYQDYSQTLHYNAQQQMLQNLVRLKYRETPFFLKVGALSVNYELQVRGLLGVEDLHDANSPIGIEAEPTVLEKPTVTYTPVEGNAFVKQMLAEIDPNVFALLVRANWPIKTLCLMLVENVSDADGKRLNAADFNTLLTALDAAQKTHDLQLQREKDQPITLVTPTVSVPLSRFRFRSFLDVMYELSKNITVPAGQQTWVRPTRDSNGLMQVQSSWLAPHNEYVSVKHNGYYFSIAQNDVVSKDAFALLQVLYQMQAGDIQSVQPVLTLPVGN